MTRSLVVFGLSLSSSWGNGHAATFRGLLRALAARGWRITFFERDVEWYRSHRDLIDPDYCELRLYEGWPDADASVSGADAVLVGSLVPNGIAIVDWLVTRDRPLVFYDIDTPITLVQLRRDGRAEYLRADQIPLFEVYFSFAGGPALRELEQRWGARRAVALYCAVDPPVYHPVASDARFECAMSYMGTYAADRQPPLEELFMTPARALPRQRFILAGPQYPAMDLPANVTHLQHVNPGDHAALYCSSGLTLNLTRQAMREYGHAPSTRLFEAAACGACIVSDTWPGLDELLAPDEEVLLANTAADVLHHLTSLSAERRTAVGAAARQRVLRDHTFDTRADEFERALARVLEPQWASAS